MQGVFFSEQEQAKGSCLDVTELHFPSTAASILWEKLGTVVPQYLESHAFPIAAF